MEWARLVWLASQGQRVPAIAQELGVAEKTVRCWLRRFDVQGMAGLAAAPRAGRPPTYTPEEAGVVVATVLRKPGALGLPFANWTLDRLVASLSEQQGITMTRSRIDQILLTEGVRWRTQESWFGARVAPACAAQRGRASAATRLRPRTA